MERVREVLKGSLGKSLGKLTEADRLAAAWTVACGARMASRGEVVGFEDGVVEIIASDQVWLEQMRSMEALLKSELARIAKVEVHGIHLRLRSHRPKGSPKGNR